MCIIVLNFEIFLLPLQILTIYVKQILHSSGLCSRSLVSFGYIYILVSIWKLIEIELFVKLLCKIVKFVLVADVREEG